MTEVDAIKTLIATPEPPELGPGPREKVESESQLGSKLEAFFEAERMPVQKQQLLRALALLWHDHLQSAHVIAQDIHTPDGSFVHAIMHRREPDYENSKYWFHRVGRHPAFPAIATAVGALLQSRQLGELRQILTADGEWDPFAFVDSCREAAGARGSRGNVLREIQRIEIECLMNSIRSR